MFPISFVRATVDAFCPPGGAILDPFCGRGAVPFVARVSGRPSIGFDLNAVAYVFTATKTDPEPDPVQLIKRFREIAAGVRKDDQRAQNEFQTMAWSPRVLGFLTAARRMLDWRNSRLDRTAMAFLLVHLHGKIGNAVSNQMRQSKSMAPDYAVRWWTQRGLMPPDLDPFRYFSDRVAWRYRFGVPKGARARIELGDASKLLPRVRRQFKMLLTSPPYYDVTNYRVDNWIRLWMLGEGALPIYSNEQRYGNKQRYSEMLRSIFSSARRTLDPDAVVYVRTDSRDFTRVTTQAILSEVWPKHNSLTRADKPKRSQTVLFGDRGGKPGDTDFLLLPQDRPIPLGFRPTPSIESVKEDHAEAA